MNWIDIGTNSLFVLKIVAMVLAVLVVVGNGRRWLGYLTPVVITGVDFIFPKLRMSHGAESGVQEFAVGILAVLVIALIAVWQKFGKYLTGKKQWNGKGSEVELPDADRNYVVSNGESFFYEIKGKKVVINEVEYELKKFELMDEEEQFYQYDNRLTFQFWALSEEELSARGLQVEQGVREIETLPDGALYPEAWGGDEKPTDHQLEHPVVSDAAGGGPQQPDGYEPKLKGGSMTAKIPLG